LFILLSRYGFCTERASRYRATFSFGRSNNNPVRAGSQLESVMQGCPLDSPFSATAQQEKHDVCIYTILTPILTNIKPLAEFHMDYNIFV
jgi:hypothetical protein